MTTRILAVQVTSREFGGTHESVKKRWVADDRRGVAGISPRQVMGICTAFAVVPTLTDGTPLCEPADVRVQPHAHAELPTHPAAGCWRADATRCTGPARWQ